MSDLGTISGLLKDLAGLVCVRQSSFDMKRVFVVGSPRSGTTLAQGLLAAHSELTSFPETHFFHHLRPTSELARAAGLAASGIGSHLRDFLHSQGRSDLATELPRIVLLKSQAVGAFIENLDTIAWDRSCRGWVEKTPRHLRHIDEITKCVPGASFIHVVRQGVDVVASMWEVTHRYPRRWSGARDIDTCVERWIESIRLSTRWKDDPRHLVVRYDELVDETTHQVERMCHFVGLESEAEIEQRYSDVVDNVIEDDEAWKQADHSRIERRQGSKFEELFSTEQRDAIVKRIEQAVPDLNLLFDNAK